jgi:ankyrin repeat protein
VVREILQHRNIQVNLGNVATGVSPLFIAAQEDRDGVIEALLSVKDIDVNQKDNTGGTPLIKACEQGSDRTVKLLLRMDGVDVNCKLQDGSTAFSIAERGGHTDIVNMLVAQSASETRVAANPLKPAPAKSKNRIFPVAL